MLTLYIIRARPCKLISLKYTDIHGGSLDWISGFQSGFLDFKVDFWIADWISGFQIGFLDFRVDFWISLDFWISDSISADSVRDFFRGGPLAHNCNPRQSSKGQRLNANATPNVLYNWGHHHTSRENNYKSQRNQYHESARSG